MRKKLKLIRQTTISECGLCCISMIASYYGYKKPVSYYRDEYNVGRDGSSVKELYLILEKNHLSSKAFKLNKPEEFVFNEEPYILLTEQNHFVVIQKEKEIFKVFDPSVGVRKITLSSLVDLNGGILISSYPNKLFVNSKEKVNDFRHVKKFFMNVFLLYSMVLLFSMLAYFISMSIPRTIEGVINEVVYQNLFVELDVIIYLLFLICSYFIISNIENNLIIKLQKNLNRNINLHTMNHILKLPYSYFDDRGEGNILYRMGLVPQLIDMISSSFVHATLNFWGMLIISLYTVYRFPYLIHFIFILILLLGIPLITFNIYMLNKKREEMSAEAKVNEIKTEIITMIFQIKSSHLTDYFSKYFKENFDKYNIKNTENKKKVYLFNLLINTYTLFAPILVILYSIKKIGPNAGELFFIYSITGMLLSNTTMFFSDITSILMIKPSLLYLNDIYDEKELTIDGVEKINKFEQLKVSELTFKYNDNSGNILHNINIEIKKGQKVSIIGVSGSGKSTLIKLLSGLYTNYSGCILINGKDIKCVKQEFFNEKVSVVTQKSTIFNKTIRDNITLEDENISDKEVWNALEVVNLHTTVQKLPMGLNTVANNNGENFSGGQGQRLALARAIVKKPSLLILDEATSSLDALNENIFFNNLKNNNVTTLVVSHRLSTIIDSDTICIMDNGVMVEKGVHDDLLENNQLYEELYKSQHNQ